MERMAQLSLGLIVAFAVLSGTALAADEGKTLTPQQQRMVDCNKQATGMSGDERKAFMSTCLKGGTAKAPAAPAAADKTASCEADAKTKGLAGEERKEFIATCAKADTAAAESAPADAPTATASTTKLSKKEKKKACGAEAKAQGFKGDARKAYVKTCMSADATAQ